MTQNNTVTPTEDELAVHVFVEYGLIEIAGWMDADPAEAIRQVTDFIEEVQPVPGLALRGSIRAYALVRAAGVLTPPAGRPIGTRFDVASQ